MYILINILQQQQSMNSTNIEDITPYSLSHKSKVFKVQQGKNFYYNKIVKGDEDYLIRMKHYIQQREYGFILKRRSFENEYIQQQMASGERFINFRSEWIHCTSILSHLNSSFIDSRFLKMDNLIEKFIAQLIVGPNQFFYTYSNAQFAQSNLFINYQSTLGFQLANQTSNICRCQLDECVPLLTHSNFEQGQFKGLNIQNKFRAIAMFIMTLIKNQVKITPNHQQTPFEDINLEMIQTLIKLKQTINQETFFQLVQQFQQQTQKDYYYFISETLCKQKKFTWQEVIEVLIMPYKCNSNDHDESFNRIVSKTAKMLYLSQPTFIKEKFERSGIVQAGQDPDCKLYLKVKLCQTSQDLLFLLKFENLSDLLDFKSEDFQKQKERILKQFFSLLIETKRRQETNINPQEQRYVFDKQELNFISTFSKDYGISTGQRYNQKIHIISPYSNILRSFIKMGQ